MTNQRVLSKSNLLDEKTEVNQGKADNQPHPDRSFYENLPFHGLKQPPKEVRGIL